MRGESNATSGFSFGVSGFNASTGGIAVDGFADATTGSPVGTRGFVNSPTGIGVQGTNNAGSGGGTGVRGDANGSFGVGVLGSALGPNGKGVFGQAGIDTNSGIAVFGSAGNAGSVAGQFGNESGGNILIGTGAGVAKVFRVDATGKVFANGGFACPNPMPSACLSTGSADFAEAIEPAGKKDGYEPGDVLVVDSGGRRRVALASEPYSTRVAGIYSTKPAVPRGR